MNDPFTNTDKCVERLFKEYQKHKKLIIAVDYDDSLHPFNNKDNTNDRAIELVKKASDLGFYIVLFTASAPDRFPNMVEFCQSKGINISSINKNPIENMPFGHNGKIYYNIFLDDRAGLGQALDTLEKTIDKIKGNP